MADPILKSMVIGMCVLKMKGDYAIRYRVLFPLDGAGLKCLFHNGGPNPAGCQTEFFRAAPNSKQPIKMAVFCFGPAFIFDTN